MGGVEVAGWRLKRGRFITLEGGEGVGKSTQTRLLGEALRKRVSGVIITREPGGTPGAEAIRSLLMTGHVDRWSARAEALLFASARADHVERVIEPALARGDWVICDRFVDSTRAYQGGAGGLSDHEVMVLHAIGTGGLMPDRTLVLQLDPGAAGVRVAGRGEGASDRFDEKGRDYHARLAAAFDRIAGNEPQRVRQIDARGSEAEVAARLLTALADLL